MHIYEVHYDNGEAWEDHFEDSEAFFLTEKAALDYINNKLGATVRHEQKWGQETNVYYTVPKFVCSREIEDCYNCPDFWDSDTYNGKIFIDPETNEQSEVCPEYYDKLEDEYDSPSWSIRTQKVVEE